MSFSVSSSPIHKSHKRLLAEDENTLTSKRRRSSLGSTLEISDSDLLDRGRATNKLVGRDSVDRYVASTSDITVPLLATPRSHKLAKALGMATDRRLVFRPQQPNILPDTHDDLHALQKSLSKSLYEVPVLPSATSASTNLKAAPEMTLSAPGIRDDFYTRQAAWSSTDLLAVATRQSVNYRNMVTSEVGYVCELVSIDLPTCLEWNPESSILTLGLDWGDVRLYDIATSRRVREFPGMEYVGGMSWCDPHVLTVGYEGGSIVHYDTRTSARRNRRTVGHKARVCGVKWSPDGNLLASGAGDGVVMLWDARACKALAMFDADQAQPDTTNSSASASSTSPTVEPNLTRLWRLKKHCSTVKALTWCPWQPDLLATGGGTRDGTIRIWSSASGKLKKTIRTRAQVSSLHFAHSCRELVSTHGYSFGGAPRAHSLLVHAYPSGEVRGCVLDVGHGRISDSCMSSDGTRIVTCGGDETIRVFRVFGKQRRVEDRREGVGMQNAIR